MSEQLNHPYSQKAIVKQIDGQSAVLLLEDGQTISWRISLLPPTTKINDQVRVIVHNKKTDEEERQRLARSILNEIMNQT